jgi:hypothetical protein
MHNAIVNAFSGGALLYNRFPFSDSSGDFSKQPNIPLCLSVFGSAILCTGTIGAVFISFAASLWAVPFNPTPVFAARSAANHFISALLYVEMKYHV